MVSKLVDGVPYACKLVFCENAALKNIIATTKMISYHCVFGSRPPSTFVIGEQVCGRITLHTVKKFLMLQSFQLLVL